MNSLPPQLLIGTSLRGNEYAWSISEFPNALSLAPSLGYACIGGQFQFRLESTICEMYWLNADPSDKGSDEALATFAHRSCSEVLEKYRIVLEQTDFKKEALQWSSVPKLSGPDVDVELYLCFVAYFIREDEYLSGQFIVEERFTPLTMIMFKLGDWWKKFLSNRHSR